MKITSFEQLFSLMPDKQRDMLITLKEINERNDFHPEENAFEHVRLVTERCIETGDNDLIVAAIFHDIFKFKMNKVNEKTGEPTARGHEDAAALMVLGVSDLIKSLGADPLMVAGICLHHMRIKNFKNFRKNKKRQMTNQPFFLKVAVFTRADNMLSTEAMPKMSGFIQDKVFFNHFTNKIEFNKKKISFK